MAQYHFAALTVQNDTTGGIRLAQDKSCSVSLQTDHGNPANANIVLEFSLDEITWFVLAAIDPTDAVTVKTAFLGPDKCGVVTLNASSLKSIRARRTDANGVAAAVTLGISQA